MRRKLIPFVAGLFLLLGARSSLALTLSDIRTAVRRNVRDNPSSTANRRYSDTVLLDYINEAQRGIINNTWASSDSSATTVVSGTTYYSIPTETIDVWRVTLNGAQLPELDLQQLDADNYDVSWSTSGTPAAYFREKSNRDQIGLQPWPSASGATLKIFFYQRVPDLSASSDVPFDSDYRLYSYHDLIIYLVSSRLLMIENRLVEADAYLKLFNSGLELMAYNVGHKKIRELAPSKVNKP